MFLPFPSLQFIFRGVNVVQLRIADTTSDEASEVCSDSRLKLMDGPLLYYDPVYFFEEERNRDIKFLDCPLKGMMAKYVVIVCK